MTIATGLKDTTMTLKTWNNWRNKMPIKRIKTTDCNKNESEKKEEKGIDDQYIGIGWYVHYLKKKGEEKETRNGRLLLLLFFKSTTSHLI